MDLLGKMLKYKIRLFAIFKERMGSDQISIDLPVNSKVKDLKLNLEKTYPGMKFQSGSALISINREFGFDEDLLPEDAEIAIFPPVSGGNNSKKTTILSIVENELDLNDLLDQISTRTTGAACFFTGIVRGITTRDDTHETLFIEYEAYRQMAEEKMKQVANEIRSRWPSIEGVVIVQRIGRLHPGEQTVVIACSAAHRDTGIFEAARYGIDRLKQIIPIWKKEFRPDGEKWVEGDYQPDRND